MEKDTKEYLDINFLAIRAELKSLNDMNKIQHENILNKQNITNGSVSDLEKWRDQANVEIIKNTNSCNSIYKYWKLVVVILILVIWLNDYIGLEKIISLLK